MNASSPVAEADPAGNRSAVGCSSTASISLAPIPAPDDSLDPPLAPPGTGDAGADGGDDQDIMFDSEVEHAALPPSAQIATPPMPAGDDGANAGEDQEMLLDAEVENTALPPPAPSACTPPPPEETTRTMCGVPVAKPIVDEGVYVEDSLEWVDGSVRARRSITHLHYLGDVALATMDKEEGGDVERGEEGTSSSPPLTRAMHAVVRNLAAPAPTSTALAARRIMCGVMLVAIGVAGGAGIVLGTQRLKNHDGGSDAKEAPETRMGSGNLGTTADSWYPFDTNTPAASDQTPPTSLSSPLSVKQSLLPGLLDPLLQSIGSDAYKIQGTPGTPQYQALEWLENTSFGVDDHFNLTSPFNVGEEDLVGSLLEIKPEERLRQRYALAVLFYSTTKEDTEDERGVGWTDKSNFLTDKHECEWSTQTSNRGVTCDTNGRVIALNLEENNLSGMLPPDLCLLPHLQTLRLAHNHLTGTLPGSYGQLTRLQWLGLEHNALGGSIPAEAGRMTALIDIHLNANAFTDGMNHFCAISTMIEFDADCFCSNYPLVVLEVNCVCCKFCCTQDIDDMEECHLNVPCPEP